MRKFLRLRVVRTKESASSNGGVPEINVSFFKFKLILSTIKKNANKFNLLAFFYFSNGYLICPRIRPPGLDLLCAFT